MAQLDEKIVMARGLKKRLEHSDIKGGVYISEKFVEFEERLFFEEKMSMWVPQIFFEMSLGIAKIKYPSEWRPKLILTSPAFTENLSLSIFDQTIQGEEIKQAAIRYRTLIRKSYPANLFFEDKIEPLGQGKLGWFDYKSYALDGQLYNLMFVTGIGGRLMLGNFNCIFNDFDEWKQYVLQMLRSITDLQQVNK